MGRRTHLIGKIREQTGARNVLLDADEVVDRLNRTFSGWANYFCLGPISKAYKTIDRYTNRRLRRWLCINRKVIGGDYSCFSAGCLYKTLGLVNLPGLTCNFLWART
jgi:hypothetical protein